MSIIRVRRILVRLERNGAGRIHHALAWAENPGLALPLETVAKRPKRL